MTALFIKCNLHSIFLGSPSIATATISIIKYKLILQPVNTDFTSCVYISLLYMTSTCMAIYSNLEESKIMILCTILRGRLKGTATVYKHVLKRCLWSQGISMYPRLYESSMATVVSFSKLWTHNKRCNMVQVSCRVYGIWGVSNLWNGL